MRLLAVCVFLDEERLLPILLESVAGQTRRPDALVLVDDGSRDGSAEIARAFSAAHPFATLLQRPPRPPAADRLAAAGELVAFQWAVEHAPGDHDALAKLDADLRLSPRTFEELLGRLEAEPELGLVGPYLASRVPGGGLVRERSAPDHVRGALKLYRRACWEQIAPLPAILGWDTADEIAARRLGWGTRSIEIPGGDVEHLRPIGAVDGRLRAYRRWGACAWGWGSHPLVVAASTARRMTERPPVLGGLNSAAGWAAAALRGAPRADRDVRAFVRREQLGQLRAAISRR